MVCFCYELAHFWDPISVAPLTTPTTNDAPDAQFLLREVTRNAKISKAIGMHSRATGKKRTGKKTHRKKAHQKKAHMYISA